VGLGCILHFFDLGHSGLLAEKLPVRYLRFNRMRYTDATSMEANLLDDGVVDTLASVVAMSAFTASYPSTPRTAPASFRAVHRHPALREACQTNACDPRRQSTSAVRVTEQTSGDLQNVVEGAVICSKGDRRRLVADRHHRVMDDRP
jgi:hypothetical protein